MENLIPPPELVQEWRRTAPHPSNEREHYHFIATSAAQWGADQELEACREWLNGGGYAGTGTSLRTARRPKPQSLAEEARVHLNQLINAIGHEGALAMAEPIRHALDALERLQQLEKQQ